MTQNGSPCAAPVESGPHTVTARLMPDVWRAVVTYAQSQNQEPETIVAEAVRGYLGLGE